MKTLGVLFTVVLMIACFCLWISRDNAINESAKLRTINAKLDNTIKTTAKTIKDLNAINVSQKATIALRNAENNAKDDKIKQLAVRFVNLQANYYKLKTKKSTRKVKSTRKITKRKIYKKPAKSARQIRREAACKKMIAEKNSILKKIGSERKGTGLYRKLKLAKDIIGKKKRVKAIREIEYKIKSYKSYIKIIEYKLRKLK